MPQNQGPVLSVSDTTDSSFSQCFSIMAPRWPVTCSRWNKNSLTWKEQFWSPCRSRDRPWLHGTGVWHSFPLPSFHWLECIHKCWRSRSHIGLCGKGTFLGQGTRELERLGSLKTLWNAIFCPDCLSWAFFMREILNTLKSQVGGMILSHSQFYLILTNKFAFSTNNRWLFLR